MAGDLLETLGIQAILNSGFNLKFITKAIAEMHWAIKNTIIGQVQDIYIENQEQFSEKEVLAMYENKTAKYTLENPLKVGAILAGADEKLLGKFPHFLFPLATFA